MSVEYTLNFGSIYFPTTSPTEAILDIQENNWRADSITICGVMNKYTYDKLVMGNMLDYITKRVEGTSYPYCMLALKVLTDDINSGEYAVLDITFSRYKVWAENNYPGGTVSGRRKKI